MCVLPYILCGTKITGYFSKYLRVYHARTQTHGHARTHTHTTQVENLFYAFSNRADPDKAVLARSTLFAHWNMIDLIIQ